MTPHPTYELIITILKLLRQHKGLWVYALINSLSCLIVFALVFSPIYHHELQANQNNHYTWVTIVAPIVLLLVYFFFHHFLHTFFLAALTSALFNVWRGGTHYFRASFRNTTKILPALFKWTWIISILGVNLPLIEGWLDNWYQYRLIKEYLAGLNWSVASYFALPAMSIHPFSPLEALKHSSQRMRQYWHKTRHPNFHLGVLFLPLSIVGLMPGMMGFMIGGHRALIIGGTLTAVLLFLIASLSTTFYWIVRCYAYAWVIGKNTHHTPLLIQKYFKTQTA